MITVQDILEGKTKFVPQGLALSKLLFKLQDLDFKFLPLNQFNNLRKYIKNIKTSSPEDDKKVAHYATHVLDIKLFTDDEIIIKKTKTLLALLPGKYRDIILRSCDNVVPGQYRGRQYLQSFVKEDVLKAIENGTHNFILNDEVGSHYNIPFCTHKDLRKVKLEKLNEIANTI
jgi:hypothetical protein